MSGPDKQIAVELQHLEGMKFEVETDGRKMSLDSSKMMGQAFTPMELFLVALAGCTAMDVEWIMGRQRQKVDKFNVTITGHRREEEPKVYDNIEIRYSLAGPDLRKDAVERAIRLSQEKYCSVRAMVKDSVKLTIAYEIKTGSQPEALYSYEQP